MFPRTLVAACAVGLLLVVSPGCSGTKGPKTAAVKGKVTYQNKALEGATVTFQVEGAPIAAGTTDANGEFTIKKVPVGSARVGITKQTGLFSGGANLTPEDMTKMARKPGTQPAQPKSEIPLKYANPNDSGLTAEVSAKEADNDFTFPLK